MRCDECKNADICLDHRELNTLQGCTSGIPDRKRLTNADRIRNMSDEELAEFLVKYDISLKDKEIEPNNWLEWLQSEAE